MSKLRSVLGYLRAKGSLRNSRLLDIVSQVYEDDPRKHGRRGQLLLVLLSPLSVVLLYWAFMNGRVNALPGFDAVPASSGVVAAVGEGAWFGQKDWVMLRERNDTYKYWAFLTAGQLVKARGGIGQPATIRWAEQWPPFLPFPYRRMFHLVVRSEVVLDYAAQVQDEQAQRPFFLLLEYFSIAHLLLALLIPWVPIFRQSTLHKVYVAQPLARAPRRTRLAWIFGILCLVLLLHALPFMALPDQMDESRIRTIHGRVVDIHKSGVIQEDISFTVSSEKSNETFSIKATLPSAEKLVETLSSREAVEVRWYPGYRGGPWGNPLPVSISIGGREITSLAWGKFAYASSVKTFKRYGYLAIVVLACMLCAPWFYHRLATRGHPAARQD